MDFREIQLNDRPVFNRYLMMKRYLACEYTFANFFLWKDVINLKCSITENAIFIKGIIPDHPFYFMPLTSSENMDHAMNQLIETGDGPIIIKCANDRSLEELSSTVLDKFDIIEDSNLNDYLYKSEDLIQLTGKKYHQKRNHVNQFKKQYSYEFEKLKLSDIPECFALNEAWKETKDEGATEMNNETIAIKTALENFSELGLTGAVIKIDGAIKAFTIGELVQDYMGIVHFEKCDRQYQGIFPAINQFFAEKAFVNVEFINRQDDMGLPGLRKSKQSYHPYEMVKKYKMILR